MNTDSVDLKKSKLPIHIVRQRLSDICINGEVKYEDNKLFWYCEEDSEDQDLMWDMYCEDAEIIRKAGFEIDNSWQDNDSCGFDIV